MAEPAGDPQNDAMIFIVVKFTAKPDARESFLEQVRPFTEGTRAEEGVLWFDWSVSVDDPHQFVLVEAFRDAEAGAAHVSSEHFRAGMGLVAVCTALLLVSIILSVLSARRETQQRKAE